LAITASRPRAPRPVGRPPPPVVFAGAGGSGSAALAPVC